MSRARTFRWGLAAKLAVSVAAGTAAFFAFFGVINLRMQRASAQDFVVQDADRITDIILRSTRYQMLRNDRDSLYNTIHDLGLEPGIRRIRIFNKDGRITLSTDAGEVGTTVDKKAEACNVCHQGAAPVSEINRLQRARLFTDPQGNHLLGVMRPIRNQPECSNASCHVHDASLTVLGVIDADLSLDAVDAQMARHQNTLTWFLIGGLALGCISALIFMWMVVHRPLKELSDGIHRVAEGDLEYRLPAGAGDELGDLAAAFNRMTGEVGSVQSRIEAEVQRKTAELESVHRTLLSSEKMASIGKLAATVAHEINNPLFGILTYARLAGREIQRRQIPESAELVEQLNTIERESKRCGELVKNLLTFSRQAPSQRAPANLNEIVHRAVLLIQHKLDMQSVELVETLGSGLPMAECDGNQIQQVILVLMVNAAEAMPKGGKLEVTTGYEGAAERLVVRVADTGGGIPAEVLPRIFDPFFTTKEDQNRTGLGLAVAHSIVEQHGGSITVDPQSGMGTTFTVTLPVVVRAG